MAFYEHTAELAGKPVVDFQRGEPLPDPDQNACRLRVGYEDEFSAADLLAELLQDPAADRLTALVIGAWAGETMYETTPAEVVEILVASAAQLPSLTALFLGDIISEENEISWIHQCDLSPLWRAFPRLESLTVRGSEGLSLGRAAHDRLKSLVIQCGGLPKSVLQEVAAAKLPALEHLELYLGTDRYGWDATIEDVKPLLQEGLFPKLRYLGLRDSQIADEVAEAVCQSPVLKQIQVLDLSLGTLGDRGAEALLDAPAVRRLQRLDLHRHYISEEMMGRLASLGIPVDLSEQEIEEDYGRYVAVGE